MDNPIIDIAMILFSLYGMARVADIFEFWLKNPYHLLKFTNSFYFYF